MTELILTYHACLAFAANVNAAALATAKAIVSGGAQASAFATAISRAISKYGCQTVQPALASACLGPTFHFCPSSNLHIIAAILSPCLASSHAGTFPSANRLYLLNSEHQLYLTEVISWELHVR